MISEGLDDSSPGDEDVPEATDEKLVLYELKAELEHEKTNLAQTI